mmetsp:Transcript_16132/g.43740  ORF Transcript_16132/g.43740 Transcript_16132/m.43740 type:complete len:220 (+) Transcript_16132:426-1085(+)
MLPRQKRQHRKPRTCHPRPPAARPRRPRHAVPLLAAAHFPRLPEGPQGTLLRLGAARAIQPGGLGVRPGPVLPLARVGAARRRRLPRAPHLPHGLPRRPRRRRAGWRRAQLGVVAGQARRARRALGVEVGGGPIDGPFRSAGCFSGGRVGEFIARWLDDRKKKLGVGHVLRRRVGGGKQSRFSIVGAAADSHFRRIGNTKESSAFADLDRIMRLIARER